MSHHAATLQSAFDKTASALNFAYALADRLYWLDDNYVQPFYSWAAPRLREAVISGFYWTLVALIDITLWMIDTTSQFMARDAQAIALGAFAHAHEPLPDFPTLCPAAMPMAFSQFLNPDHSIRRWLTAALLLVIAPFFTQAVQVSPAVLLMVRSVTKAAPVVKKTRKPKVTGEKAQDKTPRK